MTGPDPLTIEEVGDHSHDPPPALDTRTDLQRAEDTERQAFGGLDRLGKVQALIPPLIAECRNQAAHGGPVSPSIISQLEAIYALVG